MSNVSMRRLIMTILLVCLLGANSRTAVQAKQLQTPSATKTNQQQVETGQPRLPTGFRIVSSTSTSLILDIKAPSYRFETASSENQPCQVLNADDYFPASLPGEPGLLSAGVMLGIPLETAPKITIQSINTVLIPTRIHLCPAPTLSIEHDQNGQVTSNDESLNENRLSYSQDAYTPTEPVELVVSGMIRSQRVARLKFTPFLYNPVTEQIRIVEHISVEIQFGNSNSLDSQTNLIDEGPFESLLQKTLINYDQAKSWRLSHHQAPSVSVQSNNPILNDQPVYKIQVNRDGIYQVTYSALKSAGVPVDDLDPRTIKVIYQGVEIPIVVFGESDGVFDPEDYFLFYGQKITTKFTDTNVYWLSWGNGNGLRMSTQDGSVHSADFPESYRTTMHLEEDHLYFNDSPSGPLHDHWYWYLLNAYAGPVSHDFAFSLQNLDEGSSTVTIRGLLKGYYADPQHHTQIFINGHIIDDHFWPSESEYAFTIDIPTSDLVEGTNTITVSCPLDGGILYDYVLINWIEVDYDHTFTAENNQVVFNMPDQWQFQVGGFTTDAIDVFETTNPLVPVRILGGNVILNGSFYQINFEQDLNSEHHYLVLSPSRWLEPKAITQDIPSNLKDPGNGADYIIITHADFLNAIQPLATYRATQGLRVKVVDVQDIYDEFNGGVFDPLAIQNFLSYTYSQWAAPAPSYVLLVGDGHFDFKNNLGDSGPFYIPPFLGEYDPWIGETASDDHFVTISGADILPDMYIGRLPANSPAETSSMVNKILSYDQDLARGDWNTQLTFVADNADGGGNFPVHSDLIANNYLPIGYSAEKVYYGIPPNENVADAQAAIINAINQGRLIIHFTGHASIPYWAAEKLLSIDSINNFTINGKYPLFLPMTCQEGYFIRPTTPSLAESLVRADQKGAIASFSPAGFGLASGHDVLAQGLYQAFFNDGTTQFGAATTFAKYYLDINGPGFSDLIDTYNLLGDPATQLKISPTSTLVNFTGKAQPGMIQLNWETVNESWLVGFNLYRSETPDGIKQKLNSSLILAQNPGQMQGALYEYNDGVDSGKNYSYWIELIQIYGKNLVGPISLLAPFWMNLPVVIR